MRAINNTLPESEQLLMEERNPNPQYLEQQRLNWNFVYSWGWVSHKYYVANKLKEVLTSKGEDEDTIRDLFKLIFDDVPELKITEHENSIPSSQ